MLCIVELIGPCIFSHWDENGDPVGKPNPQAYVQIAAVSHEQPLSLDHKVRVRDGFKTIADLHVGDEVFDENGNLQVVARETDVLEGLDCYELTFDDGQKVTASASHAWTVNAMNGHGDEFVTTTMTTAELAAKVGKHNWTPAIPVVPAHIPNRDLPVDPYFLGYWLGAGSSENATLVVHSDDAQSLRDQLATILLPYETVTEKYHGGRTGDVWTMNVRNVKKPSRRSPEQSMFQRLRTLGVLGNKHVPAAYLAAGDDQRLALLQGLVDSDGCVDKDGRILFENTNRAIIDGFVDIARSLGYKPKVMRHHTAGWRVTFRENQGRRIARLGRKQDRVRVNDDRRNRFRYIISVEKVASVPVKCIGIDTDSHLFQVEGGILTHNTENTRDFFPSMIPQRTRTEFQMDVQKEIIYARGGRVKCKAVSANPRSLEGGRPTFLVAGEPHHWTKSNGGQKFYRTSMNNLTKSRFQARMLVITNAYEPGEESVAETIRLEQEQVWAGLKEPTGWLYDSLEAHPDAPLTADWAPHIVETIKGDSWWLNTADIVTAIQDGSIPPSTHRRFWYNQIVASEDRLYSEGDWRAIHREGCTGTKADLQPGDSIVLGFDGGKTDDATALVAIRISDRLIVPLAIWEKPEGAQGEGWEINRWHVDSEVNEAFASYDVQAFFADKALWESYIDKWRDLYGDRLLVKAGAGHSIVLDMRGNKALIAAGHESYMSHVLDKKVWHNGDRRLRIHALNAVRHHNGHGIVPFKESPESPKKIDAYVASLLAFMALEKLLESRKERDPVYDNSLYTF